VSRLIDQAYRTLPDGRRNLQIAVEGGPSWINSDEYEISAKAEGTPSQEVMSVVMLQALLEDRFKLKIRRETKEVPVYVMTVLKNGIKLESLQDGSCDARDSTKPPRPVRGTPDGLMEVLQPGQKPTCALMFVTASGGGDPRTTLWAQAANLTEFAGAVRMVVDRPVINRTGISGIFNFQMHFAAFQNATRPGGGAEPPTSPSDPAGPSIFTAIQEQLGLKLEATKGPGEFLLIDSIERPSEN
jgi:uncharacterized protein (TIGR03435 family)